MGLEYLNKEEIRNNKKKIRVALKKKSSYFIRENIVFNLVIFIIFNFSSIPLFFFLILRDYAD